MTKPKYSMFTDDSIVYSPVIRMTRPGHGNTILVGSFDHAPSTHTVLLALAVEEFQKLDGDVYVKGIRRDPETPDSDNLRRIRKVHGPEFVKSVPDWESIVEFFQEHPLQTENVDATDAEINDELGLFGRARLRLMRPLTNIIELSMRQDPSRYLSLIGSIMKVRGTEEQKSAYDSPRTKRVAYPLGQFRAQKAIERRLQNADRDVMILWDDDELDGMIDTLEKKGWTVDSTDRIPFCGLDQDDSAYALPADDIMKMMAA